MTRSKLSDIAAALAAAKTVLITTHRSPDGDGIGAGMGLLLALEKLGKRASFYNADPVPPSLGFLPFLDRVTDQLGDFSTPDVVVICDCSEPERVASDFLERVKAPVWIVLDHHRTERVFGNYHHNDAAAPSSSELVLRVLDLLNAPIDKDIADCLYTGLAVDTGNFRFSNATERAFLAAARLVGAGTDASYVAHRLFEEQPIEKLRLTSLALDTLELFLGNRLALLSLTQAMLDKAGATPDEMDGLVNFPRSLAGCSVAALLFDPGAGPIRVSLRTSLEPVDVERVARAFGGGGHQHAAGCSIDASLEQAKRLLAAEAEKMLSEINPRGVQGYIQ